MMMMMMMMRMMMMKKKKEKIMMMMMMIIILIKLLYPKQVSNYAICSKCFIIVRTKLLNFARNIL